MPLSIARIVQSPAVASEVQQALNSTGNSFVDWHRNS